MRATAEGRAKLNARAREHYQRNKDKVKAQSAAYEAKKRERLKVDGAYRLAVAATSKRARAKRMTNPVFWTRAVLGRLRFKAKRAGIPFDMTWQDVTIPIWCPVLGVELTYGKRGPFGASFDRFNPSKGYVKGNVAIISMRANAMKNDGTLDEHRRLVAWMEATSGRDAP